MIRVVGIAGGGTKSRAVLADENLKILARAEGGAANYQAYGLESVRANLKALIRSLLAGPGLKTAEVSAAVAGLAGASGPEDARILEKALSEAGLAGKRRVLSDARVDLEGGTAGSAGVLVIAGTGSMAYGIAESGAEARCGGYGYILSDEGSAYQIAFEGIRAILRSEDGRSPATGLRALFLNQLGFDRVDALRRWFFEKLKEKDEVAALAPLVFLAADEGDGAARAILDGGAEGLAGLALGVIGKLAMTEADFPLVLSGGVLEGRPRYSGGVAERVRKSAPGARPISPKEDGATGAARLALKLLKEV